MITAQEHLLREKTPGHGQTSLIHQPKAGPDVKAGSRSQIHSNWKLDSGFLFCFNFFPHQQDGLTCETAHPAQTWLGGEQNIGVFPRGFGGSNSLPGRGGLQIFPSPPPLDLCARQQSLPLPSPSLSSQPTDASDPRCKIMTENYSVIR